IDYEGSVDGVPFDGGKAENSPLELGSHSFIDTFEDQLVGHKAGEEVDVNVTFPEQYHAADLAGKPALFKVKINDVTTKELPKLDDEFASEVSEFETLAEYKEDVKKQLEAKKAEEAKRDQEDEAIAAIVEASEMEIPEAMIQTQCEDMVNEFAQRIAQSGLTMEQYMQFSGQTVQGLMDQVRPEAETRIKTSLVLEAVVKAENIEVSDEEVSAEIEKMAGMYGMDVEQLKGYMGDAEKASMKNQMAITKAVEFIMENVKEKAAKKAKKEEAEEAVTEE
ncbi:MAG: trigger factor, partial [Agathobacter sp.]|nr:trigger factor [Agathobacter sp.]